MVYRTLATGYIRQMALGFHLTLLTTASIGFAATESAVRVGFLTPFVGVYAKIGKDMDNGFKLYLEEIKHQAAGRNIVLQTEDAEAKPDVGLTKARKLVEKDQVHVLAGIIHSGVA